MKHSTLNIQLSTLILAIGFWLLAMAAPAQEITVTNIVTDTNIVRYVAADSIGLTPALSHSLQELWDVTAGSTNFAVVIGGGRGMKGNKNLAYGDFVYDLNANAALVFGYDYLFTNDKRMSPNSSASIVKGGLNLQAEIYPLKRFGLTNFMLTPFAAVLIATPTSGTSNNGGVAQIALTGIDYETAMFWGIRAHIGGFYENRTGQGGWDGNYICGHVAISKGF